MKIKSLSVLVVTVLIMALSCLPCAAEGVGEKLYNNDEGILSVAHRGDTAVYPANSLEGILSAVNIGADMVSVSVAKTLDGVLMLCEQGNLSDICMTDKKDLSAVTYAEAADLELCSQPGVPSGYKMASLEDALTVCDMGAVLICDLDWEIREDVYSFLLSHDAFGKVILRTDASASKIEKWVASKQAKPTVIGIYDDNIVFTAISHIKSLSAIGMPAVQYESKNYFNVIFGDFTAKYYSDGSNARAVAAFYDRDLCGQRSDGEDGWNELIKKGFSVIETNNIAALVAYIDSGESLSFSLSQLYAKVAAINIEMYSQASGDRLEDAMKTAGAVIAKGYASNDELESARSDLLCALDALTLKTGEDTQRGALNITFGKVLAVVLVGAALLAAQIFVHKMQKGKKEK